MAQASFAEVMKTLLKIFYLLPVLFILGVCGYMAWNHFSAKPPPIHIMTGPPFLSQSINGIKANFFTGGDAFRAAGNDVFIEFRDTNNAALDVGEVKLELGLTLPSAVMHTISKVMHTATPGQYRASVVPQVAGNWNLKLSFAGPHGQAETNIVVSVK